MTGRLADKDMALACRVTLVEGISIVTAYAS
jgi:hypothetical protein